jgi:signal transduction histidine kinase
MIGRILQDDEQETGMTTVLILNLALIATVLLVIVGGLALSIVSERDRASRVRRVRRTRARSGAIRGSAPLQW